MQERHERARRGLDARSDISLRAVRFVWRILLVAGERHHPGHRHAHEIGPLVVRVRSVLSEARNGCKDYIGFDDG